MKTKDGHTIKTRSVYYLVSGQLVGISKCKCIKIWKDTDRSNIVNVETRERVHSLYTFETERLFRSLTKAKQFCLKEIRSDMDQFKECFNLQIKRIQRM